MSTQTSLLELQTAIVQALKANATLAGVVTGVFDETAVPEDQAYPFVSIGGAVELPQNTFGRRGYIPTFLVHIWDNTSAGTTGYETCYTILQLVNPLLDQQPLTLQTQTHVYTMYDQTIEQPEPDGLTRHLVVRYKFFTQE